MSDEERKETVVRISDKYTKLRSEEKSFVAGYLAGKEEERSRYAIERGELKKA